MSRFKQVWLLFWRKDQGLGMVEIALMLPMFLMFAFAVMDFGNYMIVKNRIVSANTTIANAIRNNPTMSVSDLNTVINNTLGDLVNPHTGIWVKSFTTPPTIESVDLDSAGTWVRTRDIQNPWLADGDSANDNNTYYVGIRLLRGVPWLTPLPRMLSLDVLDPENRSGDAPYGRKIADSFSFVTLNSTITCPEGQFLSNRGGKAVCTQVDVMCENGEFLVGINGNTPDCRKMYMVKGDRFKAYDLDNGEWRNPDDCYRTWTTEERTSGGETTTCTPSRTVCRNVNGGPNVGSYRSCTTVPEVCTSTQNPDNVTETRHSNSKKNWSEYTNDSGQIWCTENYVDRVRKPSNDCPERSVMVGIFNAYTVWCAPLMIQYSIN